MISFLEWLFTWVALWSLFRWVILPCFRCFRTYRVRVTFNRIQDRRRRQMHEGTWVKYRDGNGNVYWRNEKGGQL